jgi:uncharacterized LabA/DUF88 family protein
VTIQNSAAGRDQVANTAWLMDLGYVSKTSSRAGFKLNHVAARRVLERRYGPTAAFLFTAFDASHGVSGDRLKFHDIMRGQGMQVILHQSGHSAAGVPNQRRLDVDLAAHVVWQASRPEVERVVLTTGGQEIVPVVELVRERFGKRVVLFTYAHRVSSELKQAVDEHLLFEDYVATVARGAGPAATTRAGTDGTGDTVPGNGGCGFPHLNPDPIPACDSIAPGPRGSARPVPRTGRTPCPGRPPGPPGPSEATASRSSAPHPKSDTPRAGRSRPGCARRAGRPCPARTSSAGPPGGPSACDPS